MPKEVTPIIVSRNAAIDWLKVFAVFLVMNSHMGMCYPKYGFLSTGGAIGDALFFFASGFTLFLGRLMRFDNWYKRRINRIYPSVLAAAIIAYGVWELNDNIGDILSGKRYWFLGCIMMYYILLYPIKEVNGGKYALYALGLGGAIVLIIYFLFYNDGKPFYGGGTFRYFAFFLIMLQGAIMGKNQKQYEFKAIYPLLLVGSIAMFYVFFYVGKTNALILFSFIGLMGTVRYGYLCLLARPFDRIYNTRIGGQLIYIVSQLCLEVYLMQKFVFTDELNHLFPLNIPVIMFGVLIVAYMTRMLAEFISQTFKTEPYEWGKLILHK